MPYSDNDITPEQVISGAREMIQVIRSEHPEMGKDEDRIIYTVAASYLESTMPKPLFATMIRALLYELASTRPEPALAPTEVPDTFPTEWSQS